MGCHGQFPQGKRGIHVRADLIGATMLSPVPFFQAFQ